MGRIERTHSGHYRGTTNSMKNRSGQTTGKRLVWDYDGIQSLATGQISCYELTDAEVGFLLAVFGHAIWETRWQNYPDWQTVLDFVNTIQYKLMVELDCDTPCPPQPPQPPADKCVDVWDNDCIEIENTGNELIINIKECDMPVTVNIWDGCGCGCGCGNSSGGSGTSGRQLLPGSNDSFTSTPDYSGGGIPNGITQCDFVTTTLPLVLDSLAEFVRAVDDNSENLQGAIDAIFELGDTATLVIGDVANSAGELATAVLAAGSAAILTMMLDNDFRYEVQTAWLRAHGTDGYITEVSRQDFFDTTRYLPNFFSAGSALVLPRVIFPILWRVLNINKVNSRLVIAQGTGQMGLCEYLFSQANLVYTPPTAGTLPPPLFNDVDWGMAYTVEGDLGLMSRGNLPSTAWGTWHEGQGWKYNTASGTVQQRVACQIDEELDIRGVVITLESPLEPDDYEVVLRDKFDEENIAVYSPADATNQFVFDIEETTVTIPMFWINRITVAVNPHTIIQIDVYGNGTAPTYGQPISF